MKYAKQRLRKLTIGTVALALLAGGVAPGGAVAATSPSKNASPRATVKHNSGRRVRRHHRRRVRRHYRRAVGKTRRGV